MATTTCYRIQPAGCDLGSHRSTTSNDELDRGVHVFVTLAELCSGVAGWCRLRGKLEVVAIECDDADVADNGDYEGFVLVGNAGLIVQRRAFRGWTALQDWARRYPTELEG